MYASTNNKAYRLSNLIPPWVNISDSMAAAGVIQSNNTLIKSIGGDSILYAATIYGLLESANTGATWKYSNTQLPAFQFYGLVRSGNYYVVSTNLGVYRRKVGDSTFAKVYPSKGFQGKLKLNTDSAGNIYSIIPVPITPSSSVLHNFKSTDNGITWIADTTGMKALNLTFENGFYNVDAQGNQYAGKNGKFFSKPTGAPWKIDTAGLGSAFITSVSNNNKKGIVYAVKDLGFSKFALYKRTLNGTTWQSVDVSAVGQSIVKIISDHNGDVILTAYNGNIFRYDGSSWSQIPKPTTIGNLPIIEQSVVDKNGVLWGSFYNAFNSVNRGVHFTTNNGTTWKYAGLDSVGVSFLSTVGDSVFAVTFIDGIFAFTTSPTVGVEHEQLHVASSYELYQNFPNPFNPTTEIRFTIHGSGFTSLKVYDVLGKEVATLVNEVKDAGMHSVQFNGSKLSSGVYFYTLRANNFFESKKLLLMK